jgi:hypothetical protein
MNLSLVDIRILEKPKNKTSTIYDYSDFFTVVGNLSDYSYIEISQLNDHNTPKWV